MSWIGTDAQTDAARSSADPAVARRIAAAVESCDKLPVLDKALQRVLSLADRDDATVAELVEALEQDPGLAANVLRFANSAANSVRMPVRTVRQAVTMVGRTGVRRLALDSVAFRFFEKAAGNGGVSRGHLHLHAVQVSRLAVMCAEHAGIAGDGPHLAGLLHDCGKLVMPAAFGDDAVDELIATHPTGCTRALAELERFGADHAQAGALLAAASGVDDEIVRAIAWHHGGETGLIAPDRVTACVQLADQVAGAAAGGALDDGLCTAALSVLGLPDDVLDDLAQAASGMPGAPAPAASTSQPTATLAERVRELETLALSDDLTGLASRRHWLETVRDRLAAGERGGVVLVDIDGFKIVNDTHGHKVGDVVLCEVARLAAGLGFAGRLGGDELAIWVANEPSLTGEVAEQLVQGVRRGGRATGPDGPRFTVSAGTATTRDGEHLDLLLERADEALYRAKRQGRDRAETSDARRAAA